MANKQRLKRWIIVLITTGVSVTICFFCFERIDEILFFAFLLDLFLLAQVVIFSGASLSIKVNKMLREKLKELEEKEKQ